MYLEQENNEQSRIRMKAGTSSSPTETIPRNCQKQF